MIWPGFLIAPVRSGSALEYESRGRGFESYSGHFHSHILSRLISKSYSSSNHIFYINQYHHHHFCLQYEESTAWKRSKEVKIIKDDLENKKKISDYRRKFHVFLPDISTHIGHSVSVGGQVVEKVVEEIIEEHVEETNHVSFICTI